LGHASGAGGMGFKSRADQFFNTLSTIRHRCSLDVWALAQSRRDGHRSLVTPKRVLSEYNEDLIFDLICHAASVALTLSIYKLHRG